MTATISPPDPLTLPRPPGPSRVAIVYSFLHLAKDPLNFMKTASHGRPLTRVRIGTERLVFVTDPDLIHEVLVGRASEMFKDMITHKLSETLGNGLLTSEGAFWRNQRKLMAPLFKRKQLLDYAAVMADRTLAVVQTWQDGEVRDLHVEMMALTLDIIFRTVFGAEMAPDDAGKMSHAIDMMMNQFERELRTWRRFVPQSWLKRGRAQAKEARDVLDSIVYRLIAQKREAGAQDDDLVSRLLAARSDTGEAMSDLQVRDEAVTMVVAGHETTALVLTFSAMLLSDHPEIATKLRAEVRQVLGHRQVTVDDLPNLPYLRAVVNESMRLYPPAYVIGRQVMAPIALGGRLVDTEDQILIPQWVLHHDARWFENPLEFHPDRWLDGLEDRLPHHVYMPFGGGPRVCIGQHFALMEANICLATLVQQVEWAVLPEQSRDLSPAVTLRPRHGMRAKIRKIAAESAH